MKRNIEIYHMLEGAKKAHGITVIIDVFRAFSVEAYLMNNNVDKIILVDDINKAFNYKKDNPNVILIGEREGKKIDGFDYGNSPKEILNVDFTGKTVIHTTSAGTRGITNARNARLVLTGSLLNAKAIVRYIKNSNYNDVSLVCMGLAGIRDTDEDLLCAEYIKSLLEGKKIDLEERIEKLKETDGKKFFDKNLEMFPMDDFYLCTKVDIFNFVIKLQKENNEFVMKKENI